MARADLLLRVEAAPSAGLVLAEEVRKELSTKLEEAVTGLHAEPGDVDIGTRLVEGGAASVLTTEAADADLLVVGSRGLGGFRELLLGSVSHQCAQRASCPLRIVPAQSAPGGLGVRRGRTSAATTCLGRTASPSCRRGRPGPRTTRARPRARRAPD